MSSGGLSLELLAKVDGMCKGGAARDAITNIHLDDNRNVRPNGTAHGSTYLEHKTTAVRMGGTAVTVISAVGERRERLSKQVTMARMYLNSLKTAAMDSEVSRCRKVGAKLCHVISRHCLREV